MWTGHDVIGRILAIEWSEAQTQWSCTCVFVRTVRFFHFITESNMFFLFFCFACVLTAGVGKLIVTLRMGGT